MLSGMGHIQEAAGRRKGLFQGDVTERTSVRQLPSVETLGGNVQGGRNQAPPKSIDLKITFRYS